MLPTQAITEDPWLLAITTYPLIDKVMIFSTFIKDLFFHLTYIVFSQKMYLCLPHI